MKSVCLQRLYTLFLLLTILVLQTYQHNNVKTCLLNAIVEGMQFNKDHIKAIQRYVNEEDFSNTIEITPENILDFLELENINILNDLQSLLLFTVKNDFVKTANNYNFSKKRW